MKSPFCILSLIPTLLWAAACSSYTFQNEESPDVGRSKSAVCISWDGGNDAESGFSIIGIDPDGEDIIISDIAVPTSSQAIFITQGRHNISYGQLINFYAFYPKELEMNVSNGKVSFTYDSLSKSIDILAGVKEGFIYHGNSSDNIVPIQFHHILGGLKVSVQGYDEGVEYIVRNLCVRNVASAIYCFNTGLWEDFIGIDETTIKADGSLQYFIPSAVEISVRWSYLHNGIETAEYSAVVPITLPMGKISTVKLVLSDSDSKKIGFDISVEPWNQTSAIANF